MIERKQLTAENVLVGTTAVAATLVEVIFTGHNPSLELPLMVAVANVMGVPATPMLMAAKEKVSQLLGRELSK